MPCNYVFDKVICCEYVCVCVCVCKNNERYRDNHINVNAINTQLNIPIGSKKINLKKKKIEEKKQKKKPRQLIIVIFILRII